MLALATPVETWQMEWTRSMSFSADGVVRFRLDPATNQEINYRPIALAVLGSSVLGLGVFALVIRKLQGILQTVTEDQPFAAENANRLTVIGGCPVGWLVGAKRH